MSSVVDQIETRFQRSCLHGNLKSWGDAPGSGMNAAPLALRASSVKTLGYYHGSSSSLPRQKQKRPAVISVATALWAVSRLKPAPR